MIIRLANAEVEFHDSGLTVTKYGDREIKAWPEDTDEYRARAASLGYGDVFSMSREHEVTHHMLAEWLGLGFSPTLTAVSAGDRDPVWHLEEAAVLAIQAFARSRGVDLVALAVRMSR